MAQLVLGAAGAAAGFAIGGPTGAQIGWALGSMIGASFAPKQSQTQALQDTRYLDSSYGNPLSIHFGAIPVSAANVIWASEFRAIATTTSQGGKGAPEVESTTYTYDIDLAIALSDRECVGLGRIWIDQKIVYDGRAEGGMDAIVAGGGYENIPFLGGLFEQLIEGQQWCETLTFYPGREDQEPDPTIEAALGVGNTPAYRGLTYVVIKSLKCGASPRVGQIVFELFADGTDNLVGELWVNTDVDPVFRSQPLISIIEDSVVDLSFKLADGSIEENQRLNYLDGTQIAPGAPRGYPSYIDTRALVLQSAPFYMHSTDATALYHGNQFAGIATDDGGGYGSGPWVDQTALFSDGYNTFIGAAGSADGKHVIVFYRADYVSSETPTDWTIFDASVMEVAPDPEDPSRGWRGTVGTWSSGIGTGYTSSDTQLDFMALGRMAMESDNRHVWYTTASGGSVYCKKISYDAGTDSWEIADLSVETNPIVLTGVSDPGNPKTSIFADNGICIQASGDHKIGAATRYNGMVAASPTRAAVLRHLYGRTGFDPDDDLNVATLTDHVRGYEFATPRPVRDAFETLGVIVPTDFVESDGKIKGVLRGGGQADTLEYEDIGAAEGDGVAPLVESVRQYEAEIPQRLVLRYISLPGDYKRGAQWAGHEITASNEQSTVDVPVVLTDDEAAQLADILRRDRWRSRTSFKLSTTRKKAALEPTDVVSVDDGDETRVIRITADRRRGPLIEFDAVSEGAASYTSNAVGAAVPPRQALTATSATQFEVIDVHPLRDADNGAYHYAAGAGYAGLSWPGALIYRSADGVGAWSAVGPVTTAATFGVCLTALDDVDDANVLDTGSVLRVSLTGGGTLSSCTDDDLYDYADGQVAAIGSMATGWEVIVFAEADLVSAGVYDLSRFLRGRKASDDKTGGHAIGDSFVLLSTGTTARLTASVADDMDLLRYYRGVTLNKSVADATSKELTSELRTLRPMAPAGVVGSRDTVSGDVVILFDRRNRLLSEWRDGLDAPNSEAAAERYRVRIFDGPDFDTVLRTYDVDETQATYLGTELIEDFGGPMTPLYVGVAQWSDTINTWGVEGQHSVEVGGVNTSGFDFSDGEMPDDVTVAPASIVSLVGVSYVGSSYRLGVRNPSSYEGWVRFDGIGEFTDGYIEATVRLTAPTATGCGVAYRTSSAVTMDASGRYAYYVRALNGTVQLLRGSNSNTGSVTLVQSASTTIAADTDYVLRVEFEGAAHTVKWNGATLFSTTDSTHTGPGHASLMGSDASGNYNYFDDVTIGATTY